MTSKARARFRRGGDGGFSLAELSVAMFISALVAAAAAGMVNMALQSSKASEARLTSINDARVGVESMSRSLRTAVLPRQLDGTSTDNAFLKAAPQYVFFYANINNPDNTIGPSLVTYEVTAAGGLVQTIQKPDPHLPSDHDYKYTCLPASTCSKTTRTLATGVTPAMTMFRFFDQTGAELAYTTNSNCPSATCLSTAAVEDVDAVEVKLVLQPPAGVKIGSTTYVTRVALPNHDAIIREESSP
ncbi:MAG: hypothetical protein JWN88_597 [Frankiales bacterium]|nr:hypothetical protein [Frankiales bacterium]